MTKVAGCVVVVMVLAGAAAAQDDVDLQVRGNEKVDGTLRPAGERESFLLDAPRGAVVTASVKKRGSGGPVPTLEVLDSADAVIVAGAADAKGAKLARFAMPSSDRFRLRVAGDGALDGDYQFKVKMKFQTSWKQVSEDPLAAGASTALAFSAPASATADLTFLAAPGSPLAPRIVALDGPAGFHRDFDDAGLTPFRHRLDDVVLGGAGDYTLTLRNDAAADGDWIATVKLAVPKARRVSVDIRDGALTGAFSEDACVYGRVVDTPGGLVDPADDEGPLGGASVNVPADALATPAVIAIQVSDTFFVDDTNHAAGLAVRLTPEGAVFDKPVTVTLPFDPQAFDDPASELTIFVEDSATGELEEIPRASLVIDTAASTVSFPTSHFSRFQGVSPRPRFLRGTFLQVELLGQALAGASGQISVGLSRIHGFEGQRTGNAFRRDPALISLGYGPNGISFDPGQASDPEFGTINVADDERISMDYPGGGALRFVRGREADALLEPPSPQDPFGSTSVLLRIAKGAPTRANLAGPWNASVIEFRADRDAQGAVRLGAASRTATLSFGLDGTVRASKAYASIHSAGADGRWTRAVTKAPPPPGTYAPNKALVTLDLDFGGDAATSVSLVPVLRGDVLVGTASFVEPGQQGIASAGIRLVVLVRGASGASSLGLRGRSLYSAFTASPVPGSGGGQDLWFLADDFGVAHDGKRGVRFSGSRVGSIHDALGGQQRTNESLDVTGSYSVGADGTYRETAFGGFGAVAPRGGFFLVTRPATPQVSLGFGVTAPPITK